MTFKIFHGPDAIHFVEGNSTAASGQPNEETFENESAAINRLLELQEDFFPDWSRDENYMEGARVKIGNDVFRALKDSDPGDFQVPILRLNSAAEDPSPASSPLRWKKVYDPEALAVELSP